MSDTALKVGSRVQVPKKNVKGVVAYIGNPAFSQGKWVGINLDEPKGKNNGTVDDKFYFKCEDKHGMFVRQTQLIVLDENDEPILDLTESSGTPAKTPRATSLHSVKKKSPTVAAPPPIVKKFDQSSSRLSLASQTSSQSREDLAGSTTSLSTPLSSATKRKSSFVEKTPKGKLAIPTPKITPKPQTGFVETLKPQFTPGQVIASPSPANSGSTIGINMAGGNQNVSLLLHEVDTLREQLKDCQEKYETIIVKRRQDKEKLKELEAVRIERDQLTEFKVRILESKTALQRELQQARKEAQEAIDAKNAHADEMADLADTVEMATLDKEMAEEKAESLAMELQELKDRLETVTVDYETLKAELESSAATGEPRERVSYEYKQLEQQNARLQETLVKMRDVVAQERHEYQKLMKDVDQKKSEIAELSRTKEKLSSRVEQLEEQIVDLQEQVDAAIAAEAITSTLTYDKIMLQEEVEKLREEIKELEAIESTNEEILEEQKELERELNERLDMTFARLRETQSEKEALQENLADHELTIRKYREVVKALQEERNDLSNRLQAITDQPVAMPESLDYNKVFSETIAQKRVIDIELRQIELKQMEHHIKFLTAFMPESFMGRGGDHDAILMLLLLPRVLLKCDILLSYVRDKFPPIDKIHRATVIKEDTVIRFSCGSRLAFYLHSLQMVLHQYLHGMDSCKADVLLSAGSRYPDAAIQERVVDSYVVSVKEDRLDEKALTEPLEKCVQVLDALRTSALPSASLHASHWVRDACAALSAACKAAMTDALAVQALANIESGNGANSPLILLTQYLALNLDVCSQQLRNIRLRIPDKEPVLNIPDEIMKDLSGIVLIMGRVMRTLSDLHKQARQDAILQGEPDSSVAVEKLEEDFATAADRYLDSDESAIDALKGAVASLTAVVGKLNDLVETHDYDLIGQAPPQTTRPIVERAAAVKREIDQVKILAKKLEDRELDIKELKKSLKAKGDELSEMTIRKDLLEKKLSNINKDHEEENSKLKRDLAELKEELVRKTKEFEETMDHLQVDIDNLEAEKKELKEKERILSKKADPTGKSVEISADKATSPTNVSSLEAVQMGSFVGTGDSRRLAAMLNQERMARYQLECQMASLKMKEATNLPSLTVESEETKEYQKKVEELLLQGNKLRKEVLDSTNIKIPDFSKMRPGEYYDATPYFTNIAKRDRELSAKVCEFKCEVARLAAASRRGGCVKTPLQVFPTPQMAAWLNKDQHVPLVNINIPDKEDNLDALMSALKTLGSKGYSISCAQ